MNKEANCKREITVDETIKVLRGQGIEVTEKDAEIILDFLYFLAKLTVNQYVNNLDGNNK